MPHPDEDFITRGMRGFNDPETLRRQGMASRPFYGPSLLEQSATVTLTKEVAKLRETVEQLVYWVRPMTGDLVTGKAAVEEFERITGRRL